MPIAHPLLLIQTLPNGWHRRFSSLRILAMGSIHPLWAPSIAPYRGWGAAATTIPSLSLMTGPAPPVARQPPFFSLTFDLSFHSFFCSTFFSATSSILFLLFSFEIGEDLPLRHQTNIILKMLMFCSYHVPRGSKAFWKISKKSSIW